MSKWSWHWRIKTASKEGQWASNTSSKQPLILRVHGCNTGQGSMSCLDPGHHSASPLLWPACMHPEDYRENVAQSGQSGWQPRLPTGLVCIRDHVVVSTIDCLSSSVPFPWCPCTISLPYLTMPFLGCHIYSVPVPTPPYPTQIDTQQITRRGNFDILSTMSVGWGELPWIDRWLDGEWVWDWPLGPGADVGDSNVHSLRWRKLPWAIIGKRLPRLGGGLGQVDWGNDVLYLGWPP